MIGWVCEQASQWQGAEPLSEYAKCQAVVAILRTQGIASRVEVGDVQPRRKNSLPLRVYAFILGGKGHKARAYDCRGFDGWDEIVMGSLPSSVGDFEWSFTSYLDTKWAVVAALAQEPAEVKEWIASAPVRFASTYSHQSAPEPKKKRRRLVSL